MSPRLRAPYLMLHQFLSPDEHSALLDWTLEHESSFSQGRVYGHLVDPNVRRCERLDDLGPSRSVFKSRLSDGYAEWNRQMRLSGFTLDRTELEISCYSDQAHFVYLTDAAASGGATSARALSAVYYFYREPKSFSGGVLRLYDMAAEPGGAFQENLPEQNMLVVFPSWIGHEVTPVSSPTGAFGDSRFAVNCWLTRQAAAIET